MNTMAQSPIPLIGYREDASISCLAIASRRRSSFRYAALAATALCLQATGASATTLQTPFTAQLPGGNSNHGEVFQIGALNALTITDFGINAPNDGVPDEYASVAIYEDVGAVNAATSGSGIWTQIASGGSFTSSGFDVPTELPVALNVPIAAGSTDTFLIMVSGPFDYALDYSNGGSVGDVMASNTDLNILQGWGEASDFTAYDPREANVSVDYTASSSPVPEPASLAVLGVAMAGLGFTRRRSGKPSDQGALLELSRAR
jgi:hypothetical protein